VGCGLSRSASTLEALVSHRKARTTVHSGLLIVQRHLQGWPQSHIAKAMGSRAGVRLGGSVVRPLRARPACMTGPHDRIAARAGPAATSSSGSWSCAAVSAVDRTGLGAELGVPDSRWRRLARARPRDVS
jgi:hypothetical protein